MHELSLAQSIAEIAQQAASANGDRKVMSVGIRVGELSGVIVDSLTFCFAAITAGTTLEGAALRVDRVPVRAQCRECRTLCGVDNLVFLCPSCGSGDLDIIAGRELQVTDIEVNDEPGEQT